MQTDGGGRPRPPMRGEKITRGVRRSIEGSKDQSRGRKINRGGERSMKGGSEDQGRGSEDQIARGHSAALNESEGTTRRDGQVQITGIPRGVVGPRAERRISAR